MHGAVIFVGVVFAAVYFGSYLLQAAIWLAMIAFRLVWLLAQVVFLGGVYIVAGPKAFAAMVRPNDPVSLAERDRRLRERFGGPSGPSIGGI